MIKLEERKASIQPIKSKLKISILDDQEISQINQNTRTVLEEVDPRRFAREIHCHLTARLYYGRSAAGP
jgi:hypothetical protein